MSRQTNASASGGVWDRPISAPELEANRSQVDIDTWWVLVDRVIAVAKPYGWTKAEVSRRSGVPDGTFSGWFSGKYKGRYDAINRDIAQWLDAIEESAGIAAIIPTSPAFMNLRGTQEIVETLIWAQLCPDLVMVTIGPGMGKTMTARHFARTRPHVYHATVSENTKTVHGMLVELAEEMEVREHNPARLARAIGNRIKRTGDGTLLIVDEAQHLNDEAVNQLRYFLDIHHCGVALLGNSEVYSRFSTRNSGKSYAQLKRRIGKRLQRLQPYPEDIATYIASWGVSDAASIQFLTGIGMKGGAFGQIDKTMKLATILALGDGDALALKHIQRAWKNRDVEDMG